MTTQSTAKIHPERQRRVANALKFFSVSAWVTGVFLLILVVRMVLEYVLKVEIPEWATWVAILHGWAFIIYLLSVLNLGLKARWKPVVWFTTAIAGVVPFLSFIVEANRRREVKAAFHLD
ncbi:hypothetical protein CATRI_10630 [Corynebacterium atrinae]|uniref:DUF3817 domain-containing protein n=1 Tax=Corynebacterium atrinae TaxID=1336740 RepID=UPI0025B54B2F|nr:DUF3817 domain-containing protein [Corynebacterium atrinae]WJY64186.1 hypothetical protein CATRI_10630 [Corynebacterium atrinae]